MVCKTAEVTRGYAYVCACVKQSESVVAYVYEGHCVASVIWKHVPETESLGFVTSRQVHEELALS